MQAKESDKPTLKGLIKVFFETFKEAEVTIYSIVITYYLLLSFFPLLIALGNVLPYLNIDEQTVMPYIRELLPPDIYVMLNETIVDLLSKSNGGLLSASAVGTFWAVSKGINGIQISLNKAYGIKKEKMQFTRRLFSFLMVFLLILVIILLMVIMGFGQTILEYVLPVLGLPEEILTTFITLRWPVTSSVLFVILLMLYYFVPSAKIHFRTILLGATFTTLCWMVVTQFFSLYIKHFSKSISSYGVIGSFILFIFWLNIAATLIIIGGVMNVTLEKVYYGEICSKRNAVGNYLENKLAQNEFKERKNKQQRNG
ncbi:MAG: YihY/virulence factor BrkB family protein [Vagococcus sp.]